MELFTLTLEIVGLLGFLIGFSNALMDRSKDGRKISWLFNLDWFNKMNVHYTKREKKRVGIWIFTIPNDFWHVVKFIKIILTMMSVFAGISFGIVSMIHPVFESIWLMIVVYAGGGACLWYVLRIFGFSIWYECLLWKKPLDGIDNYFTKHEQR